MKRNLSWLKFVSRIVLTPIMGIVVAVTFYAIHLEELLMQVNCWACNAAGGKPKVYYGEPPAQPQAVRRIHNIADWSLLRQAIDNGCTGHYSSQSIDFWGIVVDESPLSALTCDMPKVCAFGNLDGEVTKYFALASSQEFEATYMSRLTLQTSIGENHG